MSPGRRRNWCAARPASIIVIRSPTSRNPGQPRTAEYIRALVLKIARKTGWGYARVLGELKKLGIRSVSKTTVANIVKCREQLGGRLKHYYRAVA